MEIIKYHQITLDEYMAAKEEIKNRLNNMANDYIHIGYLLKQIQETEAYRNDGYTSLSEFAKAEYGLSESATSRFIAINTRFSIGGFSPNLLPEFENLGSSKLSEMLTLSDEDCRLIKEKTTVATIRDIKKFNKEVQEDTVQAEVATETGTPDTEETREAPDAQPQKMQELQGQQWTGIRKAIVEFFRDKKDLLNNIYELSSNEDIAEMINPSGNLTFRKGIHMLFLYPYQEGVALKTFGSQNETYTWPEFIKIMVEVFGTTYKEPGRIWQEFYGEELISETCDVASGKNNSSQSEINKNRDFKAKKQQETEEKQKKEKEKAAIPSKIQENTEYQEENKQIEGQAEIKEYFDVNGNYIVPEEHIKETEVLQKSAKYLEVFRTTYGVRLLENGCEIVKEDCIDELSSIIMCEISKKVVEGYKVKIEFMEG